MSDLASAMQATLGPPSSRGIGYPAADIRSVVALALHSALVKRGFAGNPPAVSDDDSKSVQFVCEYTLPSYEHGFLLEVRCRSENILVTLSEQTKSKNLERIGLSGSRYEPQHGTVAADRWDAVATGLERIDALVEEHLVSKVTAKATRKLTPDPVESQLPRSWPRGVTAAVLAAVVVAAAALHMRRRR